MLGQITKAGTHDVSADPTIEAAFAMAGGWSGKGGGLAPHIPHPPFSLVLNRAGKLTKVRLVTDPKTRVVRVKDPEWKAYKLCDGDIITLPEVVF
ncbi:hypothetical protein [Haloferula sp. BvORR071]|uniref:hypothetical protein n=1 Tax=Haloferula sp. BvORR071 TaxID=1396141 RepID=UPI0005584F1E|nr:hypothetical protein [Haloferula sp. BvORR071]